MASKSPAVKPPAEVAVNIDDLLPDLVATTTLEIEGKDVNYPRLKVSHSSQKYVIDGDVPYEAIYSDLNKEDDDKIVRYSPPKSGEGPDLSKDPNAGILVYVLAMKKGLSCNVDSSGNVVPRDTKGATFRSWAYDDPTAPRGPGVDETFNYVVYCPEFEDNDRPFRILMTRSNTPTARTMNTFLDIARKVGRPAYTVPFRIWSERRERDDDGQHQRWGVFKARTVTPTHDHLVAASLMTSFVNVAPPEAEQKALENTAGDEPAI